MVFATYMALAWYTNHGQSVKVPDLKGLTYDQVKSHLANYDLQFIVNDSTYIEGKPKGIILDQYPSALSLVKPNRRIYLKINMYAIPKIKMPNIVDASFRQARDMLESYGLKLGKVSYKPDKAENAILSMSIGGVAIKTGDLVKRGSLVDLVVGDGLGNTLIPVPNLIGLTLEEAQFLLSGSSLQLGAVVPDNDVTDMKTAIIYKQTPESEEMVKLSDETAEERAQREKEAAIRKQLEKIEKENPKPKGDKEPEKPEYELVNEVKPGYIKLGDFVDIWLSNKTLPSMSGSTKDQINPLDYNQEYLINSADSMPYEADENETEEGSKEKP